MFRSCLIFIMFWNSVLPDVGLADEWSPPPDSTGFDVFMIARDAARGGNYELALKVHQWIFFESPKKMPELAGIRTSYAISGWCEISNHYEPARLAIEQALDGLENAIRQGREDNVAKFRDLVAVKQALNKTDDISQLFLAIENRNHAESKEIFSDNYEVLRSELRPALMRKYLDGDREFDQLARMYGATLENSPNSRVASLSTNRFQSKVENLASDLESIGNSELASDVRIRAKKLINEQVKTADR